ncbi:MAG TPA: MFS transporter, partial [Solirubrobacteraceae bacterium]|nr:MFS transporter [Solirubrobacteraceae bacterium]
KLFLLTLLVYIVATVATAFSTTALFFFIARFFTGAGIGGEYAAINSAIDELIPARVRGRVDLIINGSYWLGAAAGALGSLVLLNTNIFAADVGWRIAFGLGAVLGLAILIVRRHVPESPRWLFIHGREEEAERIVDGIEREVEEETSEPLDDPGGAITVHQRKTISFREVARTAFKVYPKRTILGFALFIGQAFIYNAVTFDLGSILSEFFNIESGKVPIYIALFAVSNFLGPLLLGRLFDTIGRKPMVAFTYIGSGVVLIVLTILFVGGSLGLWGFMALLLGTFFLASAGASSAYLTVSEIFPMETRALAIAFFYAIGTAVGGITGPLLFAKLIATGNESSVAVGFYLGAGIMIIGGIVEIVLGVKAEGQQLEDIATPLTAEGEEQEQKPPKPQRRPSPRSGYSRGMPVSAPIEPVEFSREVVRIESALGEHGAMERSELARAVGARFWGPGRFPGALREAVRTGRAQRLGRTRFGPAGGLGGDAGERFRRDSAPSPTSEPR